MLIMTSHEEEVTIDILNVKTADFEKLSKKIRQKPRKGAIHANENVRPSTRYLQIQIGNTIITVIEQNEP